MNETGTRGFFGSGKGYFLFSLVVLLGLALVFVGLERPVVGNGGAIFLAERDLTTVRVVQVLAICVAFFAWLGFGAASWFALGGAAAALGLAGYRLVVVESVAGEGAGGMPVLLSSVAVGGGPLLLAGLVVLAIAAWRGPVLRWRAEREAWHNL